MNTKIMAVMAAAFALQTQAQLSTTTLSTPAPREVPAGAPPQAPPTATPTPAPIGVSGARAGGGGGIVTATAPRSSANYGTRLNSVVARSGSAPGDNLVVCFTPMAEKDRTELAEDLQVLEFIIGRNLEKALGEKQTEYRLGVPMLLSGDGRVVQASYLQGFGVNVKVRVPYPVVGTKDAPKKKSDSAASATEWEKARRAALGGEAASTEPGEALDGPAYDESLVTALKKQLFDALKNGSNLRHVKGDEWIAITVIGGGAFQSQPGGMTVYGSGGGGYGGQTMVSSYGKASPAGILTMRIKKSDADGSAEEVAKAAQMNSYADASDGDNRPTQRRIPTAAR